MLKSNPYTSPADLVTPARNGKVAFAWNALIAVAILGVGALAVRFLVSYFGTVVGGDSPDPEAWTIFALQTANTLSVALGMFLVLTSLSTMPVHRRPLLTRAIAISACVLISLDFHMLRWRIAPEFPARAMVFAAMMPTLIVFGCSVPHAASYLLQRFRSLRTDQSGG